MSAQKMEVSTVRRLLEGLGGLLGEHTLCLHGGEPLLIGKQWFAEYLELVGEHNRANSGCPPVSLTVQTNGILVDKGWVELFRRGDVGVSVSLDGPKEIHDYARVSAANGGTHEAVLSRIKMMAGSGIRLGAIAVISKRTLEMPPSEFYRYFRDIPLENGLDFVPYIETGSSEIEQEAKEALEADEKALSKYLRDLFDLWLFDTDMVHRVDLRIFEQMVGIALGFTPSLCSLTQGASCGRTPNLMPNGDIYACDLDVLGLDFRLGSVFHDGIAEICSPYRLKQLHEKIMAGLRARGCTECRLIGFCGLTCPRHVFSSRDHSPYCKMVEELVDHAEKRLNAISNDAFHHSIEFDNRTTPFVNEVES